MLIYVDIDNTICNTNGMDYKEAQPIPENIEKANKWLDEGHEVVYWTARGAKTGIDWLKLTVEQLKAWGARYSAISLDKPAFDILVDDRAMRWEEI
jgi:predicted mannosyl-3-phosphoglycerate phosphatase (HAD superfamily)